MRLFTVNLTVMANSLCRWNGRLRNKNHPQRPADLQDHPHGGTHEDHPRKPAGTQATPPPVRATSSQGRVAAGAAGDTNYVRGANLPYQYQNDLRQRINRTEKRRKNPPSYQ